MTPLHNVAGIVLLVMLFALFVIGGIAVGGLAGGGVGGGAFIALVLATHFRARLMPQRYWYEQ